MGRVTNTRLDSATGHDRSIVRPNKLWNDQSTSRVRTITQAKRSANLLCFLLDEIRNGSETDWKVNRTSTPSSCRHNTWTPMPCQSASKRRCGFNKLAMPDKDLHGKSFRNGVKFSVQTCSEGRDAWRIRWGIPQSGNSPSGSNERVGDVVRSSSSDPREAQKRPARAFRRPFHRSSMLMQGIH